MPTPNSASNDAHNEELNRQLKNEQEFNKAMDDALAGLGNLSSAVEQKRVEMDRIDSDFDKTEEAIKAWDKEKITENEQATSTPPNLEPVEVPDNVHTTDEDESTDRVSASEETDDEKGHLYIPFNFKEGDPPTYYKTEEELQALQAADMRHFIQNAPRIYNVVRELLDNEEKNGKDKPLGGNADTSETNNTSPTTNVDTNTNT